MKLKLSIYLDLGTKDLTGSNQLLCQVLTIICILNGTLEKKEKQQAGAEQDRAQPG